MKMGVKILKIDENGGQNSTWLKNRGQNCAMLEKGSQYSTLPLKVGVKILHRFKKGGQKGRAYPLPQT